RPRAGCAGRFPCPLPPQAARRRGALPTPRHASGARSRRMISCMTRGAGASSPGSEQEAGHEVDAEGVVEGGRGRRAGGGGVGRDGDRGGGAGPARGGGERGGGGGGAAAEPGGARAVPGGEV